MAANHRLFKMAGFDLPGIGRFCPPADNFGADYNGWRYLFPGKKQLDMFWEDPTKYAIE